MLVERHSLIKTADRGRRLVLLGLAAVLLTACGFLPGGEDIERLPQATTVPVVAGQPGTPTAMALAAAPDALPSRANLPPPTYTPAAVDTPIPTSSPPTTETGAPDPPSPSPQPYVGLLIADLINRDYGGGQLEIIDTLEINDAFTRYAFTYPSDGLTIHGFLNVPNEGSRFPVVIALHGYVDPDQYQTLDYTTRYADHLARAGYFVLHPNLRGFPPSDDDDSAYRVGLAVDVLNLIAILREQSQDPTGYLRRADADDINLWGHSMGGGVTLRVITVDNSPYVRSAVLYGAMSGDERRNYEKIQQWSNGEVGEFELAAAPAVLKAISPINYLDRINAAVSIHHGAADDVVPPEWSEELCQRLTALQHPVECYSYPNMPHTFRGANDELFKERAAAFFDRN